MLLEPVNFIAGLVLSLIIAGLAYKGKSLSTSGLVGTVVIGTSLFGFGGWQPFLLIVLFFVSSSVLTKFRYQRKAEIGVAEMKAGARNIWQTIGQGGVASIVAFVSALYPSSWAPLMVGLIAAIGEANADTWAVEIGVLSRKKPKLVTNLSKEVVPGTSGGISPLGEAAAFLGSVFIAFFGIVTGLGGQNVLMALLVSVVSAFLGEHIDSILGATIQAVYYCPKCQKETERKIHRCGTATEHIRGLPFMSNEFVNFLGTASAAVLAVIFYTMFF
jgi:uncharacterized protein (TIGR00297 family)